jgi:hypothetical protein
VDVASRPGELSLASGKRFSGLEGVRRRRASRTKAPLIAFAVFLPIALRLLLLPWIPPPQPVIQDEFSYLLAGDTFASGRLTNPEHRLWVFFESVHIIQQPTYMSKYPPLNGLTLALGQRVFGHPWIGVLVSIALFSGTLAWALQCWLPPVWASIGTAVAVLKIGFLSYWSESYWGGAIAAVGGALLIGCVPNLVRRPQFRAGIPAGIGVAILANSRPFEGLLLTVITLSYVAWRIIRESGSAMIALQKLMRGIAAPLAVIMVPTGVWMSFYNFRVTGDPLLLPYMVHERQYAAASVFFWRNPGPAPVYRHEALRQAWRWDLERKTFQREHFLLTRALFYDSLEKFYLGLPLLVLIIAFTHASLRKRRIRPAFWLAFLFLIALGVELEFNPHYAAPATALIYIIAAGALRELWHWRRNGSDLRQVICGAALLLIAVQLVGDLFHPEHQFLYDKRTFQTERARVLQFLKGMPGKQLVFVRYGTNHDVNNEWVYNRANIDDSAIAWARSMGPVNDRALIAYFKDRRVWLLDENGSAKIYPYPDSETR